MARTWRKRWIFDDTTDEQHLTEARENSCRPGCKVCGKHFKRIERRKERHEQRQQIDTEWVDHTEIQE